MNGAFVLAVVLIMMVVVVFYLIGNMVRSIQDERRQANIKRIWGNFGLSIAFCVLFIVTWLGQGLVQWQVFTDEAREHGQSVEVGDFAAEFAQSTLENWQSEFLQLFSFVVMSALLIHHGSAESKDSDDRMEAALKRIEQKLGTRS